MVYIYVPPRSQTRHSLCEKYGVIRTSSENPECDQAVTWIASRVVTGTLPEQSNGYGVGYLSEGVSPRVQKSTALSPKYSQWINQVIAGGQEKGNNNTRHTGDYHVRSMWKGSDAE